MIEVKRSGIFTATSKGQPIVGDPGHAVVVDECSRNDTHMEYLMTLTLHQHSTTSSIITLTYTVVKLSETFMCFQFSDFHNFLSSDHHDTERQRMKDTFCSKATNQLTIALPDASQAKQA